MNKYQQYKHTTRTFDRSTPVDADLESKIQKIFNANKKYFKAALIIKDVSTIEKIYDNSDIPNETGIIDEKYQPRKNAQLLAPMLLLLVNKDKDPESAYHAGRVYSQIGLMAIDSGYHTGFCICYDRPAVGKILENQINDSSVFLTVVNVFMSIGKKHPDHEYFYSLPDNRFIKSAEKVNKDYITFSNEI